MKVFLCCALSCVFSLGIANDLTLNFWEGNVSMFQFNGDSVQLNSEEAGEAFISRKFKYADSLRIEFELKLNFSPSLSNQVKVFLFSDSLNPMESKNGLFFKIGESGSDDSIDFFQVINGEDAFLVSLAGGEFKSETPSVKFICIKTGDEFAIHVYLKSGNVILSKQIDLSDELDSLLNVYFAFHCMYTKSNAAGFSLMNLQIWNTKNSVAPVRFVIEKNHELMNVIRMESFLLPAETVNLISQKQLVKFGIENASEIAFEQNEFIETQDSIDFIVYNEVGGSISTRFNHWFYRLDRGDVVFSEVLSNLDGNTGVEHDVQYVELFNKSNHPVNMEELQLKINGTVRNLPFYELPPNEYILLIDESKSEEISWSNVLFVENWHALNKTDNELELLVGGVLIDDVEYTNDNFSPSFKMEGGWSIENGGLKEDCGGVSAWNYSTSTFGGTPGIENSIQEYAVRHDFFVSELVVDSDTSVSVTFSTGIVGDLKDYLIALSPLTISSFHQLKFNQYKVYFEEDFIVGEVYEMVLKTTVSSCAVSPLENDVKIKFGVPVIPKMTDVIINELLFDADVGVAEYIEIKNISNDVIDLGRLFLTEPGISSRSYSCGKKGSFLLPDSILCLTKDKASVVDRYLNDAKRGFRNDLEIPNLKQEGGKLRLINGSGETIDEEQYGEHLHSVDLPDFKGVAIERDFRNEVLYGWKSASFSTDYGSPGYENSTGYQVLKASVGFNLQNKVIDLLHETDEFNALKISYSFPVDGYFVSVSIFNAEGKGEFLLLESVSVNAKGVLKLEELLPYTRSLRSGNYMLLLEAVHPREINFTSKEIVSIIN